MFRNLFNSASPLALSIGFDGEGGGEGGGTPAPSPAPAPAPSLLGGEGEGDGDAGNGDGDAGTGGGDGANDTGGDDGEGGDGADDDAAAAAKAEEERRAALTDEERAAEDAAKTGAPEEYDFAPLFEGQEDAPQLDAELLGEFTSILKEDNLTQEQANKYMGFAQKLQDKWLAEVTQAHVDARAAWRQEAQADPEIGGDKFAEKVATAKKALDAFGSPALKTLLNETGLGDHPEMIRFFHNVGVVNSEHDFVKSGRTEKPKSFYDHPTSRKKD